MVSNLEGTCFHNSMVKTRDNKVRSKKKNPRPMFFILGMTTHDDLHDAVRASSSHSIKRQAPEQHIKNTTHASLRFLRVGGHSHLKFLKD